MSGVPRTISALGLVVMLAGCATAYARGQEALHAGRYADAARELEAAAGDSKRPADALTALGIARYKLHDLAAAAEALRRALSADATRADARLYLALSELGLRDDARALSDLEALRPLVRHPRIAATVARAIAAVREGLSDPARTLAAASLEDAVEWARDVQLASHTHIYALEPSWSLYRDRLYVPLR
jgi:Tfp pilus assembly protein PilF